jgi:hypothetical protein
MYLWSRSNCVEPVLEFYRFGHEQEIMENVQYKENLINVV